MVVSQKETALIKVCFFGLVSVSVHLMLRYWLWRDIAPYYNNDLARKSLLRDPINMPTLGKVWLAVSMSFLILSFTVITLSIVLCIEVYRIPNILSYIVFIVFVASVCSFSHPFDKLSGAEK